MKHNPVEKLLQDGLAHHQAGRLAEAEGLYRRVLAVSPLHPNANNFLGVLASQVGRHDVAEGLFSKAIQANPKTAEFHNNRGLALQALGRREEAASSFGAAIRLNPKFPEAHNNLGALFQEEERFEDAARAFEQAIRLRPDYAEAAFNLGNALLRLKRNEEAAERFEQALRSRRDYPKALCGLGQARQRLGAMEEAERAFVAAIRLQPDMPEFLSNYAFFLRQRGRLDEAEQSYRRALEINPRFAEACNGLGELHQILGKPGLAEECFRRAIGLKPSYAEAHNNLGVLYWERGRAEDALACYRRALDADPGFAAALNNMGNVHGSLGRLNEAMDCFRRAVDMDESFALAYNNQGNIWLEMGQLGEAEKCFRKGLEIDPGLDMALSNLGLVLMARGEVAQAKEVYARALTRNPESPVAHSNLIFLMDFDPGASVETQQAERRKWAAIHAAPLKQTWRPHGNDRNPDRKLRIGYVSADFRMHSAAYAFEPMLLHYDRERFEVYCYSNSARADQMTEKFRGSVNGWRNIFGRNDDEVAAMIRADGVDILVDLSAHSAGNRLLLFARKPAPVQVSGWGQANGAGLEAMDYLVSDPVSIPACERGHYVEEIVDLPCQISYQCPADAPPVAEPPMLKSGAVTFGCFNKLAKLKEDSFALWAELLRGLPGSRLLLKAAELSDPGQQARLRQIFANLGIEPARIDLRGRTTWLEHLRQFADVDISLDPVSYSGGISTFESLWMGAPVVALNGDAMTRRSSAAILSSLGLTAWVAQSAEAYVDLALRESREGLKLAQLRHSLRETMRSSAVCDPARYQSMLEQQYRKMWRKWTGHE